MQLPVFEHDAPVHNHLEPGFFSQCGCLLIDDTRLHPYHAGTDRNSLPDYGCNVFGVAEDIDNVYFLGDREKIGIAGLAQ
jgi:uncharacterized protein YigE (DUF2233 family)